MISPILVAGGAASAVGVAALLLFGGDSRADKRRAAVQRPAGKTAATSVQADKAQRRKQIADGLRDLEKANRQRLTLRSRIEQAGLSISPPQFLIVCAIAGLVIGAAAWVQSGSLVVAGPAAVAGGAGLPQFALEMAAAAADRQVHRQFPDGDRHHRARRQVRPAARRHDPHRGQGVRRSGARRVPQDRARRTTARAHAARGRRAHGAARSGRRNQFLLDRHLRSKARRAATCPRRSATCPASCASARR